MDVLYVWVLNLMFYMVLDFNALHKDIQYSIVVKQ